MLGIVGIVTVGFGIWGGLTSNETVAGAVGTDALLGTKFIAPFTTCFGLTAALTSKPTIGSVTDFV